MTNIEDHILLRAFDEFVREFERRGMGDASTVREVWPVDRVLQRNASIYRNSAGYFLVSVSGFGAEMKREECLMRSLPSDSKASEIGAAVQEVLTDSRRLSLDALRLDPAHSLDIKAINERFLAKFLLISKAKGKKALFQDMVLVHLNERGGKVRFTPTRHDRLDGWSGVGFKTEDTLEINSEASAPELGTACLLALDKCIDAYAKK